MHISKLYRAKSKGRKGGKSETEKTDITFVFYGTIWTCELMSGAWYKEIEKKQKVRMKICLYNCM